MKLISWNVNGLRACMKKGFGDFFENQNADIFCIQETKLQPDQWETTFDGYYQYLNSADKKGYSGTAVFCKTEPLRVSMGIGIDEHDHEGRVITLEFEKFILINVYTPNSQRELLRLPYRKEWEDAFRSYVLEKEKQKPVVICGDLNVAHEEIDLKNPKTNHNNAGFTDDEREKLTVLLKSGFLDSFRYLNPDKTDAYTWWSYMFGAREKNVGWRIDYFLVSDSLKDNLKDSVIYSDILGSDHCPIGITLEF